MTDEECRKRMMQYQDEIASMLSKLIVHQNGLTAVRMFYVVDHGDGTTSIATTAGRAEGREDDARIIQSAMAAFLTAIADGTIEDDLNTVPPSIKH